MHPQNRKNVWNQLHILCRPIQRLTRIAGCYVSSTECSYHIHEKIIIKKGKKNHLFSQTGKICLKSWMIKIKKRKITMFFKIFAHNFVKFFFWKTFTSRKRQMKHQKLVFSIKFCITILTRSLCSLKKNQKIWTDFSRHWEMF